MKLQNMAVIFAIIILPISIILGIYIDNQISTLQLQVEYDSKLDNATYDALKTFQLNTINNSVSDQSNSKIRDVEASVNTFFDSVASNFNMAGYNKDILKEYVPALVYTMYDGYYIYSDYENKLSDNDYKTEEELTEEEKTMGIKQSTYIDGETLSGLKSYVYYSCRYKKNDLDVVINYSLDNYITIKGLKGTTVIDEAGYLIDNISGNSITNIKYRGIDIPSEGLLEETIVDQAQNNGKYPYHKINGVKYYYDNSTNRWFSILNGQRQQGEEDKFKDSYNYDNSAREYYLKAKEFMDKIQSYGIDQIKTSDAIDSGGNKIFDENYEIFKDSKHSIEEPNSNFNQHRREVIKYSIESNLSTAIANFNNYTGSTNDFQMPKLKETEWDDLLNHISIISFLQGLNIGGKVYNGYSIITNTKNKEVVSEDSIYILTQDGYYHSPMEDGLQSQPILKGILNIDLERKSVMTQNGKLEYYPVIALGSYDSIVSQNKLLEVENIYELFNKKIGFDNDLAKKYFTALGRERYSMYRQENDYEKLKEEQKNWE